MSDAMADQQTKPVGQSASALHPVMTPAAQPDQPGLREPGRIPIGASPPSRQSVMHIDTGSAAENAATVPVPNEVACGCGISAQLRLPFRYRADQRLVPRQH